jgi:co-chaperonin GroES (HSP10)
LRQLPRSVRNFVLCPVYHDICFAEYQTPGGLLLPESNIGKSNEGEVLAVGPGRFNRDGQAIPVNVAAGDKVLLPEYGGTSIKDGDNELFLFREEEILAKIGK